MTEIQWIVLAIVQGLTEFLPISSSAHLILPSQLLGWADQGLAFDVAVHLGSLLAVVLYFRKDIAAMLVHWTLSLLGKPHQAAIARAGWMVILGTIPAVILGFLLKDFIETTVRDYSVLVIAVTTILFGLLLFYADRTAKEQRVVEQLSFKDILFIGLAQAIALIPGTSRSGITMTAGLMIGLKKSDAARFSFLLSIPLITAAGLLLSIDLVQNPAEFDLPSMLFGSILSFVAAFSCIVLFLKWIERTGFLPFVIYRLVLGAILLFVYFS